jgi:hypothetical protein
VLQVRSEIRQQVLAALGATTVIVEAAHTVPVSEPLGQPAPDGVLEPLRRVGVDLLEIWPAPTLGT